MKQEAAVESRNQRAEIHTMRTEEPDPKADFGLQTCKGAGEQLSGTRASGRWDGRLRLALKIMNEVEAFLDIWVERG